MPLSFMEHFLLQCVDIEATKDWYVNVLGMRVGPHPDFKFPVYWLYLGDSDVLHITQGGANVSENRKRYVGQESQAVEGSGVIDHVAFRATDLEGIRRLLNTRIEVDSALASLRARIEARAKQIEEEKQKPPTPPPTSGGEATPIPGTEGNGEPPKPTPVIVRARRSYSTPAELEQLITQLQQALASGQPVNIEFD